MRFACALLGVSIVLAPAVHGVDASPGGAERDQAVIGAILRGSVVEAVGKLGVRQTSKELSPTVLSAETLVICGAKPPGPCISPHVTEVARASAAAGKVPQPLVPLLERNTVAQFLSVVAFRNLSMVERLSDLKGQAPYPMAVSAPVYYRAWSLVYVQFGHPYNNLTWLTLVAYSRENDWTVVSEFPVSVGDAP